MPVFESVGRVTYVDARSYPSPFNPEKDRVVLDGSALDYACARHQLTDFMEKHGELVVTPFIQRELANYLHTQKCKTSGHHQASTVVQVLTYMKNGGIVQSSAGLGKGSLERKILEIGSFATPKQVASVHLTEYFNRCVKKARPIVSYLKKKNKKSRQRKNLKAGDLIWDKIPLPADLRTNRAVLQEVNAEAVEQCGYAIESAIRDVEINFAGSQNKFARSDTIKEYMQRIAPLVTSGVNHFWYDVLRVCCSKRSYSEAKRGASSRILKRQLPGKADLGAIMVSLFAETDKETVKVLSKDNDWHFLLLFASLARDLCKCYS